MTPPLPLPVPYHSGMTGDVLGGEICVEADGQDSREDRVAFRAMSPSRREAIASVSTTHEHAERELRHLFDLGYEAALHRWREAHPLPKDHPHA